MKLGRRTVCDTCGRVESEKLKIYEHPTEKNKHLCDPCKQDVYFENISMIAKQKDNRRMI
ncbi:MAG: hypothetical protein ACW98F_17865 [Candidatus Hodarchaeales archaeon]|jgi:hypothetical protein